MHVLLCVPLFALLAVVAPIGVSGKVTKLDVDFSTFTSGTSVSTFLDQHNLYASDYTIQSTPLSRQFSPANVDIQDGVLRLKVGGLPSGQGVVQSAEIGTYGTSIRYGIFTTIAQLTPVSGVCAGFFTYTDDNHEIDIEALSSYYTTGYGSSVPPGLEFTNQPLTADESSTNTAVAYNFDPTADFHNYTLVWSSDKSEFYVDGKLRTTFTENVPTVGASFIWNAWSNGDPNWSAGPPAEDSYTLIREVHLAYTSA